MSAALQNYFFANRNVEVIDKTSVATHQDDTLHLSNKAGATSQKLLDYERISCSWSCL